MQVKIFRAANLQAALEEIREQLGPNASVLRTRQCRDGWMGWLGRSYVEVTASSPELGSEKTDTTAATEAIPSWSSAPVRPADGSRRGRGNASLADTASPAPPAIDPLGGDPLDAFQHKLMALGVQPEAARRWVRTTSGLIAPFDELPEQSWLQHLQHTVARELRLAGPIELGSGGRRVVALVGPTGVGKTTTVAKLAAGYRMHSQRRVGLLTIDTFRIAAVQQLQAYAQIMDLPMVVVESAEQMRGGLEQLSDADLVLIDTAGRSPKGDVNVQRLSELLRLAQPDETHLVLSATSTAAVIRTALEGFRVAQPTAAIMSKLDEAPYTAAALSALTASNDAPAIPISYITNGQQVPNDIAIASAAQLVERLLPTPIDLPQTEAA